MALYVTVTRGVSADEHTVIDAQFLNLLGQPIVEIRGTISGEGAVSISDGSITTQKLADATDPSTGVTDAKLAHMPAGTIKGNDSGITAAPENLTAAEARALLSVQADGVTLEHYTDAGGKLRAKDAGISAAKLAPLAVTSPKLDFRPPAVITGATANLSVAAALTFSCEPTGNASYTLVWAASDEGKSVLVRVKSPGSYTLAFAVSGETSLTLRWKGNTPISPSTTAGQVDLVLFTRIGANVYATPVQSFTG